MKSFLYNHHGLIRVYVMYLKCIKTFRQINIDLEKSVNIPMNTTWDYAIDLLYEALPELCNDRAIKNVFEYIQFSSLYDWIVDNNELPPYELGLKEFVSDAIDAIAIHEVNKEATKEALDVSEVSFDDMDEEMLMHYQTQWYLTFVSPYLKKEDIEEILTEIYFQAAVLVENENADEQAFMIEYLDNAYAAYSIEEWVVMYLLLIGKLSVLIEERKHNKRGNRT
ncbi:hypothetical protein [Bacillus cereus]|uniref:hypothetical protein n=1 Tax=Bacillus cereus TaxID=1396 RepID=UPI00187AE063|nr:hypothetical protein [Bacillus cereus]MBE7123145.1 hypothetical protein [Bacillus cereus]